MNGKIQPVLASQGQIIFAEGAPSDGTMYFIIEGEVSVTKKGFGEIRTLKKGHFFGEMALVNALPRTASVSVVSEQARLGAINRQSFAFLAKTNPQFLMNVIKVVATRAVRAIDRVERKNVQL